MPDAWLDQPYNLSRKRVWVAGHKGMVGAALCRRLECENVELLTVAKGDLDLCDQAAVNAWMSEQKPQAVVIAAAKVGGIYANATQPAEFFYTNMMIAANVMHAAYNNNVERLLYLGSSCIYPRDCELPMREDALLSGALEPTNEAYALAKIGGLKMAQYYRKQYGCDFISAMPCNLYGVGDSYHEEFSHVIASIIMKANKAKREGLPELVLWGSGKAMREFLYVDDLADALVLLLQKYSGNAHVNVGSGDEFTIKKLSEIICERVGYTGKIVFDTSKPDGVPRKVLDNSMLSGVGWHPEMCLKDGVNKCCEDYEGRYGVER